MAFLVYSQVGSVGPADRVGYSLGHTARAVAPGHSLAGSEDLGQYKKELYRREGKGRRCFLGDRIV